MLHTLITQPITNILFTLTAIIPGHDFGIAVILLTVLIRFALWPLAAKQLHSQKALTAIQPEVEKLKEKHKGDSQKLNMAVMELYKEKEVSPFSSCLPMLIQLPILFGIFYVFSGFAKADYASFTSAKGILKEIYPFIKNWGPVHEYIANSAGIKTTFLGVIDLAKANIPLAAIAAVLQFIQSKMMLPKTQQKDAASAISTQMTYIFPVMTFVIAFSLASALPLYWSITTGFAILQQYLIMHRDVEKIEEGVIVKEEKKEKKDAPRLARGEKAKSKKKRKKK